MTAAYLTKQQVVDDILATMTETERETWKAVPKDELIACHHTTGRAIRNHYKLWDNLNPHLEGKHPDDYSMEIVEAVWESINKS